MDRRAFLAAALSSAAGARHYFVEQDETPGPALASLKLSADYLKQLEF